MNDSGGWADLLVQAWQRAGRRLRLLLHAVPILATAGSVVLGPLAAGLNDLGDWAFLIGSALLLALAGTVQSLLVWLQRSDSARSQADALAEASRLRVAMKDALQPLSELIAEMPGIKARERRIDHLRLVSQQAVGALILLLEDIDQLRAVVYAVTPNGRAMRQLAYQGRGSTPRDFEVGTPRGDFALELVREGRTIFVPDIATASRSDWAGTGGDYATFISATIRTATSSYGMVTVDAPRAGDLVDTDREIVQLVANLLAIAFAQAER